MSDFDDTNRGSLFSNKDRKKSETDPDFSGSININGAEYWLKGWTKTAKTSGKKFIRLWIRPKGAEAAKKKSNFNDEIGF